jgi:glycosyltransferase involved in cell wall biosynthesis
VTRTRIAKHYGRSSTVLYPPIDVAKFTPGGTKSDYYVVVARPVPYKRIDIAVEAARRMRRRLIVIGGDHVKTDESVEYVGRVSDERLVDYLRGARGFLSPQEEDFGMALLEASACGTPAVAYRAGGAAETVLDGVTGVFAIEQSVESFVDAINRFECREFDPRQLRRHAESFSKDRFKDAVYRIVRQYYYANQEESAYGRDIRVAVGAGI